MFDNRNDRAITEDKIADKIDAKAMSLTIIHLNGQHYVYSTRYPHERFGKFRPTDYSNDQPLEHREIMAHYDNATLYNDYVIETIIRKIEDKDAILIYIPDHGEEIYDYRDYCGHGNAATSPDLKYQIDIPMFVWVSDKYKESHKNQVSALKNSVNKPISSYDISHFLVDLADIKSSYLDPTRSFINDKYNTTRHRKILYSIDYDKDRR